jgi:hypothetical protein
MPSFSPDSGWRAEAPIGMIPVDHGRHSSDLDKLVRVAQHGRSYDCARCIVLPEYLSNDNPCVG